MRRKLIAAALTALLAFGTVACSSGSGDTTTEES